jgi:hypothetical protein
LLSSRQLFSLLIPLVETQEKQKKKKQKPKPKSRFLASLSYEAMLLFTKSPNHCTRKTIPLVLAWGDLKTTASKMTPESHM